MANALNDLIEQHELIAAVDTKNLPQVEEQLSFELPDGAPTSAEDDRLEKDDFLTPEKQETVIRSALPVAEYNAPQMDDGKPDQVSLMAKYGVTEQDAFAMCRQKGLLSPLYEHSHRGGCWFCPNASMTELRHLYHAHPDLWQLMLELQDTPNKATERFNRNFTFAELDLRFRLEGEQLSFYDQELEVER